MDKNKKPFVPNTYGMSEYEKEQTERLYLLGVNHTVEEYLAHQEMKEAINKVKS